MILTTEVNDERAASSTIGAPLLPVLLLLVGEVAAALWAQFVAPTDLYALTALTAGGILAIGLIPVLLRPGWLIGRVGSLAILLSALIWYAGAVPLPAPLSLEALAAALAQPQAALGLLNGVMIIPLTLHIVTRFPRRSNISDRMIGAAYTGFGLTAIAAVLTTGTWRIALLVAVAACAYAGIIFAGWLLIWAIRDPRPVQQQQLAQARLLLVSLIMAITPVLSLPAVRLLGGAVPPLLLLAMQVCFPIAVLYAILRHDLLRIDVALRRALGYAATSLGLLAIYFGLTLTLTTLLSDLTPLSSQLSTVLGVLGAASAFPWIQAQAGRLITRAFFPERLSFQQELAAAQSTLGRVVSRDEVIHLLTVELPERLGAQGAHLQLLPDPPPAEGGAWHTPLMVAGRRLGMYWLGPRRTGLPYAPDEQERLRGLAQQAALALAYAESYEALASLNSELEARVEARTAQLLAHQRELATVAERQRLARDLHDSLKQTLFSLGLNLHAAAGLMQRDPERARGLIAQQAERVVQAQSELADLLSDLRTPANTTIDLVTALRDEVAQLEAHHHFRVTVAAPASLELDEPTSHELAAIAREALHNALKHSGVDRAHLRLSSAEHGLVLIVSDAGKGFDPANPTTGGYGLRGIHERVAALGGTLTVKAAEGTGTELWVHIPIQPSFES